MLKIESGILLLPPQHSGRAGSNSKYRDTLMAMKVGDSVFFPGKYNKNGNVNTAMSFAISGRKRFGYTMATRQAPGGTRVWRTG